MGHDWARIIDRASQRINDAPDQSLADRNLNDATGSANGIAFLDVTVFAQNDRTDIVFFQVKGDTHDATGKFQQFRYGGVFQSVHAGDAVAYLKDSSNADFLGPALVLIQLLFQDAGDFIGS
jgi:hypothetical protein